MKVKQNVLLQGVINLRIHKATPISQPLLSELENGYVKNRNFNADTITEELHASTPSPLSRSLL